MNTIYDVVVVGGGHAGCEAALACARMGCRTLLFNINLDSIALMSCNPAVGGTGKGQLVKEIDALGGEMGKIADQTVLHCRELNASKGPAVRSTRFQCDKQLYRLKMKEILEKEKLIAIRQSMVEKIVLEGSKVVGVLDCVGVFYEVKKVIITTGTFLNGRIHIGTTQFAAGRAGEEASLPLANSLREIGFEMGRMKTGTPPRLRASTIDFSQLIRQDSDENPTPFSFTTERLFAERTPSYFSETNDETHNIIKNSISLSPLYAGEIKGVGARYCPSLEDKVMRFSHRNSHPVVLENEGLHTEEIYAKGLGNCLPPHLQEQIVRSVRGLEEAQIMRFAYAVEYDFVQPTQLWHTLETKLAHGLYLAGQINGTSGYEEAAAQGLCAGINAASAITGREPFILRRDEAYIGIMIDDLVTQGVDEPYRMFTSRAEHRLILREDNARIRLLKKGYELGLVDKSYNDRMGVQIAEIACRIKKLSAHKLYPVESINAALLSIGSTTLKNPVSLFDMLKRDNINYNSLSVFDGWEEISDSFAKKQIEIEAKYEGYIKRQQNIITNTQNATDKKISTELDYDNIASLSNELRTKLKKIMPTTIGQAQRISGMTQSAIDAIIIGMKKLERTSKI